MRCNNDYGISPDGRNPAYCARRDRSYGVHTMDVEGGVKTRLADGRHIERMTDDDRVNWFPHPSPTGDAVLYLAYEGGVDGHPRDHEVELRLMDLRDGDPHGGGVRTLLAIFGGQGSINVPCWHPGGRRFAFVRYARS